jgi:replicative DNA helicase
MSDFTLIDNSPPETGLDIASLKMPPHSIEAEQSLLGGLMLVNEAWDTVAERVTEADFYRQDHRLIFQVMSDLIAESQPLDVITISERLAGMGQLDTPGGLSLAYLGELVSNTPSAANIAAYAAIVRERSTRRSLIAAANDISDTSFNPEGRSGDEVLDEAERRIMQVAEGRPKEGGPQVVDGLLKSTLDKIDELYRSDGNLTGISTGFTDLDDKTSGLQRADLVIVAGRPSMGKTSFAMNLVENAALVIDEPVLVFSMEMPAESLVTRMLSSIGKIDQTRLRNGDLQDEDWSKLSTAVNALKDRKLLIDDTPALTPTEIRSRARRVAREHGSIGLIMVDYLQLMRVAGASEGRTAEISEISRSLKGIAKEFNCPMVALSQLNRSLEQRPNKRPVMSDLRESGAIEQDADVIMFIYRDEVYHEESPDKGVAEIIIGKQRNGPIGTSRLAFFGQYTRFENLARGYEGGGY